MRKIESYKGFETTFLAIKMNARMIYITILTTLIFHAVFFFLILFLWLDTLDLHIVFTLIKGWIFSFFAPNKSILFNISDNHYYLKSTAVHNYIINYVIPNTPLKHKFIVSVYCSFAAYIMLPFLFYTFWKRSQEHSLKEHLRGPKLVTVNEFKKQINQYDCYIPFGEDVKMPVDHEAKHLLLTGSPGSGKTVVLSRVINALIKRGDNLIVYDFKGDFVSKFYRSDKDFLFNPLDIRCLNWNVFNEMKTIYDIEAFSASLIPPATGDNIFWNDAARDVLTGILVYLNQNNKKTNKHIWDTVTLNIDKISKILQVTPGAERGYAYIQDGSSKQAISVQSVLMQYVKSFEYLQYIDGDFSIREWIKQPLGNIYIPNYANTKDTLKPILSLFVDLMGRQLLSLKDDYKRRIFFFLDEFGTLQHLSTIINLLTLGRSKGASVWIGIQDLGQLENIYGKDLRSTIINACGNCVFLRIEDPVTGQYLSDKIGKAVFFVPQESYSMGIMDNRDGVSLSKSEKIENLVMASELIGLEDLEGYVSFVGTHVTKYKFPYVAYSCKNESLIENQKVTKIPTYENICDDNSESDPYELEARFDDKKPDTSLAKQSILLNLIVAFKSLFKNNKTISIINEPTPTITSSASMHNKQDCGSLKIAIDEEIILNDSEIISHENESESQEILSRDDNPNIQKDENDTNTNNDEFSVEDVSKPINKEPLVDGMSLI